LKTKKSKHGGKRDGAGRKKKPIAPPITYIPVASGQSAEELAKQNLDAMIAVQVHIALHGESEAARVSAAEKVINRAVGMPKPGTAAKSDQLELADDWGDLLKSKQPAAGRSN
jgi:hypothetical protein